MQHVPPTLAVYAVVSDGARARITDIGCDAVTVHPTGVLSQPSLHWSTLAELQAWHHDLGNQIAGLARHRADARVALNEMDNTLRRVGAR